MSNYLYRLFKGSLIIYKQIFLEFENDAILFRLVASKLLLFNSIYQGQPEKLG
jgi:hypothetical protein